MATTETPTTEQRLFALASLSVEVGVCGAAANLTNAGCNVSRARSDLFWLTEARTYLVRAKAEIAAAEAALDLIESGSIEALDAGVAAHRAEVNACLAAHYGERLAGAAQ